MRSKKLSFSFACNCENSMIGSPTGKRFLARKGRKTMAKLYFRYGTMGSAKTMNLLSVAHNYRQQHKTILLIKPELDTRYGRDLIRSRAGLEMTADLLVNKDTVIDQTSLAEVDCLLVDEVQFLAPHIIDQFRQIATKLKIPVICYGLRTDFRQQLFPGTKRLLELADTIEEVKTTCARCRKKAIFNLKLTDKKERTGSEEQIELGADELYQPVCAKHYDRWPD